MSIGYKGLRSLMNFGEVAGERMGGMIAFIPSIDDVNRLARWGYEKPEDLHITAYYLGEQPPQQKELIHMAASRAASQIQVFESRTWAACHFNPNGEDPCATYLVGGSPLEEAHNLVVEELFNEVDREFLPMNHAPWVPHITIGYFMDPSNLTEFGPIIVDRIRVAFGPEWTDYPLAKGLTALRS